MDALLIPHVENQVDQQRGIKTIFEISDTKYSKDENLKSFYTKFRTVICNHLKKKGDTELLFEDEIISPTFEEVIILWCLEKIDPSLPTKVKQTFSNKLHGQVTLRDIHDDIFDFIPEFMKCNINTSLLTHKDSVIKDCDELNGDFIKEENSDKKEKIDTEINQTTSRILRYQNTNLSCAKDRIRFLQVLNTKKSKTKQQFFCRVCMKRFINNYQLEMHKRYHSNDEKYPKTAISPSVAKNSLQKRKSLKLHICDFCDKSFYSPRKLNHHIDSDHGINLDESKPKKAKTMRTRKDTTEENSIINEPTIEESQLDKSLIAPKLEPEVLETESESFKDKRDVDNLLKENDQDSEASLNNDFDAFADDINGVDEANDDDNDEDDGDDKLKCRSCGETFLQNRQLVFHKQMTHGKFKNSDLTKDMNEWKERVNKSHEMKEENKQKKFMKVPCEVCGKNIMRMRYRAHLKCHEEKIFKCFKCKIKFDDRLQYKDHMNALHPEELLLKKVFCELCGVTVCNLKDHIKKRHTTKLKCGTCKRGFTGEEELNSHVCKHFTCDICDEKFILFKNLNLHKREHAGEIFHHCDFCEGLFRTRKRFLAHRRHNHTNPPEKSFACDMCDKAFSKPRDLKRHSVVHYPAERPHKCLECPAAFKLKEALSIHMKTHTDDRQYKCDGCGKTFISVGNLKQHKEKKGCGVGENDVYKSRA